MAPVPEAPESDLATRAKELFKCIEGSGRPLQLLRPPLSAMNLRPIAEEIFNQHPLKVRLYFSVVKGQREPHCDGMIHLVVSQPISERHFEAGVRAIVPRLNKDGTPTHPFVLMQVAEERILPATPEQLQEFGLWEPHIE